MDEKTRSFRRVVRARRMLEQGLTDRQAASALSVHPVTLRRWRASGDGPPFVRILVRGREVIRYSRDALAAWAKEHGFTVKE